jgi:PAS domain S-box-containing protein
VGQQQEAAPARLAQPGPQEVAPVAAGAVERDHQRPLSRALVALRHIEGEAAALCAGRRLLGPPGRLEQTYRDPRRGLGIEAIEVSVEGGLHEVAAERREGAAQGVEGALRLAVAAQRLERAQERALRRRRLEEGGERLLGELGRLAQPFVDLGEPLGRPFGPEGAQRLAQALGGRGQDPSEPGEPGRMQASRRALEPVERGEARAPQPCDGASPGLPRLRHARVIDSPEDLRWRLWMGSARLPLRWEDPGCGSGSQHGSAQHDASARFPLPTRPGSVAGFSVRRPRGRGRSSLAPSPRPLPDDPALARKLALVALRTESAVALGDAEGCVEWVNAAFERITGYRAEEIRGKRFDLLGGLDPGTSTLDFVLTRFQRGESSRLEVPARSKDGSSLWLAVEVQPLGDPPGSQGFIAVATDVTERRRAAEALAESEERYRQLVELSPDPIGVHCGGRWVFLNAVAARLLGAERPEELLGRAVLDSVHPDSRPAVEERIERVLRTGEPVPPALVRVLRVDGSTASVEITGARVTHAGEPAVQLVARDLSSRRRAESERLASVAREEESRRGEALATLARGLARELEGVVGTVLAETDGALAEPWSEEVAGRSLRAIRRAALRGGRVTGQLVAYAGRRDLVREPLDLSRLVLRTCELVEASLASRALLSLDLAGNLPPVLGDALKLREVIASLVRNASEAVAQGGTITVRTSLAEEAPGGSGAGGPRVRLEVIDNGCGMDRETLARAFEPFFSTRGAKRGLGLAAVQGIVAAHGGRARLASRPGAGTTATVELPAASAPAPRRRRSAEHPPPGSAPPAQRGAGS